MQLNQAFHYINQRLHHWNLIYATFNSLLALFIVYLEKALNYYHGVTDSLSWTGFLQAGGAREEMPSFILCFRSEILPQQTVLEQILLSLGNDKIKGLLLQRFFLIPGATRGSGTLVAFQSRGCLCAIWDNITGSKMLVNIFAIAFGSSHKYLHTENGVLLVCISNSGTYCPFFPLYFKATSTPSFHK